MDFNPVRLNFSRINIAVLVGEFVLGEFDFVFGIDLRGESEVIKEVFAASHPPFHPSSTLSASQLKGCWPNIR